MSLSFTVSTTAADRVAADLLAVPVAKGPELGPGADAVDAALDGGLAAFLAEAGFEGKLGETLAVPTGGRLKAKAALLVGIGDPAELTVDGVRRAAAAVARRAGKAASLATTLATAGTELAVADAAQAVAEGLVLGGYQYLEYKGNATPSKLKKVTIIAAGGAPVKAAVERGAADRRRGHVGARPGEPAVEGQDAVRRGRRGRASCCAAPASPCRCST